MNDSQLPADGDTPARMWRRSFLRAAVGGTAAWSVLSVLAPAARAASGARRPVASIAVREVPQGPE